MTEIGLNTDSVALNQKTVTDSIQHLPKPIQKATEYAEDQYTTGFKVTDKTVFKYLNKKLPGDQELTGNIETVIDDKLIIDITSHENIISEEYGHNKLTLGHEFWISIFGCEAVESVTRTTDKFGEPVTHVIMFSVMKLYRDLSSQLDNQEYGYSTDLFTEHGPDRRNVFSEMMANPYCLAMLYAEQEQQNKENEKTDDENTSSNRTTAGLDRTTDRTTKYET